MIDSSHIICVSRPMCQVDILLLLIGAPHASLWIEVDTCSGVQWGADPVSPLVDYSPYLLLLFGLGWVPVLRGVQDQDSGAGTA